MTRTWKYGWILFAFCVTMLAGCASRQQRLNRRVTLWRKDKIPYGTFFAYEHLKYLFPDADISVNKSSPADYSLLSKSEDGPPFFQGHNKAYIIITSQFFPTQREINSLMNFVGEGNQLFISSFYFSDSLLQSLKIGLGVMPRYILSEDSLQVSVASPVYNDTLYFAYPGLSADNYVSSLDSQYTTVLGWDKKGRPDFVKFGYKGGGAIFLHFAPTAMTNFFLLHKNNKTYFDNVFSYMPSTVRDVRWDEYFRYAKAGNFSALGYLMSNTSFRWAVWLTVLLFAIIYIFESKRRQRPVPVIKPLNNSSLDFVLTVGRLYYQQGDESNLASKMITHFLDFVRSKYYLSTQVLDDDFSERLSYKSGYNREGVGNIVHAIRNFQEHGSLGENLLTFNHKLEAFYKNG